jgi:SNF2 family DNA or RNA helicase
LNSDADNIPTRETAVALNCEQFDQTKWEECCKFFRADATQRDPDTKISIKGIKRGILPYQLYAVYWMLHQERSPAGGGFLSDEQGLGKTTEALLLCIVNRMLLEAKLEVRRAVKDSNHPSHLKHLKSDDQLPDAQCPSEEIGDFQFAIACPCAKSSPSYSMAPKYGPSLVICPAMLVTVWRDEFKQIIDQDEQGKNTMDMEIYVAHRYEKNPDANIFTGRVGSQVIIVTAPGSFEGHVRHKWNQPAKPEGIGKKPAKLGSKATKQERARYDRSIRLIKKAKENKLAQEVAKGRVTKKWSRIIRDEFHMEKNVGTKTLQLMAELEGDKGKSPFIWALSGTPWEASPSDLQAYINVLERRARNPAAWGKGDLQFAQKLAFRNIIADHAALVTFTMQGQKRRVTRARFEEQFGTVLRALMIRRTVDSRWFNDPMLKLKPNRHRNLGSEPKFEYLIDLELERRSAHKKLNQALLKVNANTTKGQSGQLNGTILNQRPIHRVRMAVTVPGIARLRREIALGNKKYFKWDMTAAEITKKTNRWYDETGGESDAPILSFCLDTNVFGGGSIVSSHGSSFVMLEHALGQSQFKS